MFSPLDPDPRDLGTGPRPLLARGGSRPLPWRPTYAEDQGPSLPASLLKSTPSP